MSHREVGMADIFVSVSFDGNYLIFLKKNSFLFVLQEKSFFP